LLQLSRSDLCVRRIFSYSSRQRRSKQVLPFCPSLTDTDDIAERLGDTAHRFVLIRVEAKVGAMAYRSSGLPSMF
jgi:hypothetical protein